MPKTKPKIIREVRLQQEKNIPKVSQLIELLRKVSPGGISERLLCKGLKITPLTLATYSIIATRNSSYKIFKQKHSDIYLIKLKETKDEKC